jgi:hypothetical protein
LGKDAVSTRGSLGPHPVFVNVVVVKVSPKVILSALGFSPIPSLLNVQVGTVHVGHVPSVSELGEFSAGAEGSLAHVVSSGIASNVNASNGVSDSDDSASPALIVGLVGVAVGGEIGVVVIEWAVEHLGVDDAKHWQLFGAGSISELRVTSIA